MTTLKSCIQHANELLYDSLLFKICTCKLGGEISVGVLARTMQICHIHHRVQLKFNICFVKVSETHLWRMSFDKWFIYR